jgi:hypothetical protein
MRRRTKARSHQKIAKPVTHSTVEGRLMQLREKVPGLFRPRFHSATILYIGASKRAHCLQELWEAGHEITLLEAWGDNAAMYFDDRRVKHVRVGLAQEVDRAALPYYKYDVVFWWHGPEHVGYTELNTTLDSLEATAPWVILACPWGKYIQNKTGGNPYEEHLSHLYPEMFKARGYETATLGQKDVKGSNLLAWR